MSKKISGVVIKVIDERTVKVRVVSAFPHKKYKKIVKKHSNYLCHNDGHEVYVNENVLIQEGKPVSKLKSWYLVEVC